jgi:signal peptidase I
MKTKVIPNTDFFALVEKVIRAGGSLEVAVRGSSMRPALVDGRHRVVLVPYRREYLRVGMIALIVCNGRHILHRLVGVEGDTLVFRGDNLPHTAERVTEGEVVAFVRSIIGPRGRVTDCMGYRWMFWSRLCALASRLRSTASCRFRYLLAGIHNVTHHGR